MAGFLRGVTQLTLSFGGASANITDLQRGGYSRVALSGQNDEVRKNLNNNTVIAGARNQPDLAWDLTFFASEATVQALEDIHLSSKTSPTPQCQLVDLVAPIIDTATLTRLAAPAPNNTVTTLASGNKSYFAQFNVIITDINTRGAIKGQLPDGTNVWEVQLSLEEGDESA